MSGPDLVNRRLEPSVVPGLVRFLTGLPDPRFLRFLLVGALNTIFGYAVFLLLLNLGMNVGVALVASTLAGIVFNFQTTRSLVFRSTESGLLLRFTSVYLIVLITDYAAVVGLKRLAFHDWSAQALVLVPMAALSFLAQRNLVFGNRAS